MVRKKTKVVSVGGVAIGGDNAVAVQSMLCAPSGDINGNISQAKRLKAAGCDILRIAVPDKQSLKTLEAVKKSVDIPLVADIHYDYRLAIESIEAGADKIRLNPGNIGSDDRVKAVVDRCRLKSIPIRIGVNSGSVEKIFLEKYGGPTPGAMCDSAMRHVKLIEKFDYDNIVLSIKSSHVADMVEGYSMLSEMCYYPLHLGVTEAGTERMGIIKSSIGIGSLLLKGIGDTIRVSLTADPVREVEAAKDILKSLKLSGGVEVISCPTCGRTRIDIISLSKQVEDRLRLMDKDVTVAVMGCAVNGPGEARGADYGIAGGDGEGILFRKGEIIRKVPEEKLVDELFLLIESE